MNKDKLNTIRLHAGIHTLSAIGTFTGAPMDRGITKTTDKLNQNTGEIQSTLKINPNVYLYGDAAYINDFKEFRHILKDITKRYFEDQPIITRVDFRIDNYGGQYTDLLKINKIVLLLLAKYLNINNRWESTDPIALYRKTVRAQDKRYEIEYYDRFDKTGREGLTRSRLEVRNKGLKVPINAMPGLLREWCERLKNIVVNYDALQNEYNSKLFSLWQDEREQRITVSVLDFVRKYQQNICTSQQLQKLLAMMGANNPKMLAYEYRYKADMEFISANDLKQYTKILKRALQEFCGRC